MPTPQDLIDFMLGEVGYYRHNDPLPGTKYGRWYAEYTGSPWFGTNGVPFCAMFGSYCDYHVGVTSAVTPSAVTFDERDDFRGRYVDKWELQMGDHLSFDWDYDECGDHFGTVYRPLGDGWYETIEGNVDGGYVKICNRHVGQIICGCRPDWDNSDPIEHAPSVGKLEVDGAGGPATISEWQRAMGTFVDGEISGQIASLKRYHRNMWSVSYNYGSGSSLMKAVQGRLGVYQDGIWGPKTSAAIQSILKEWGYYDGEIDSDFGHHSVQALQQSLNDGRW